MASSRATTSAVSLDNWESLAPLNDKAKASIALITEAASEKPLPARLIKNTRSLQTATNTRPGTPLGSTTNLLRRAASRADLGSNSRAVGSADSSVPSTPRPRSPSRSNLYFSPSGTGHANHTGGQGHARMHSATSALALQLHPHTMSSPATYVNGTPHHNISDPLEVHSPIETPQQFLDWFSGVEASMESDQEEVFRRYEMEIDAYIASCDEASEMLEDSRGLIKEMEANYRFVEDNSKALQLACEAMLEEQKHLIEVTDAIDARLEYFKELETATRALSQPGDKVVLHEDFLGMIERLDACLDFLKTKRNYRDAEVYIIRFQQCLTRAMTLIKMHFLQLLNSVYVEVAGKLSGNSGGSTSKATSGISGVNLSETALNALLYAKFTTLSQSTRVYIVELEKRALKNPDEYGSLLADCVNAWTGVRRQLLGPSIAEEVRRMDPSNSDLVKLARSGCAYLRNVCMSEWTLFRDFFAYSGQEEVYRYLETMCDYLYDSLRPRILHETKLEVLCELCNVLQALMALDGDEGDDEDIDEQQEGESEGLALRGMRKGDATVTEDSFDFTLANSSTARRANQSGHLADEDNAFLPPGSLRFSELLSTVLQDTQTRLVFRAQYVIESEVLHYSPKPEDLDYPGKLQRKRKEVALSKGKGRETRTAPSLSQWQKEHGGHNAMGIVEEDGVVEFKLPPEEVMEDWYPTLRKTLWILSKLHSYVNSAIFEDFAGEAVNLCRQSLALAAEKIAALPEASKLDGQLFVIRHLLILKEMVRSLDLVSIERGVVFGSVADALASILRSTTSTLSSLATFRNPSAAIMGLAGRGVAGFNELMNPGNSNATTMRDAKRELDASLKIICEDLMSQASLMVAAPLGAFLARCRAYLAQAEAQSAGASNATVADLTTQAWATSEEVLKLHETFLAEGGEAASMEKGLRDFLDKLRVFLVDEEDETAASEGGDDKSKATDGNKAMNVLVPPTLSEILEHYTTFYNLVKAEYSFEVSGKLTHPATVGERLRSIAGEAISVSGGAWNKSREG